MKKKIAVKKHKARSLWNDTIAVKKSKPVKQKARPKPKATKKSNLVTTHPSSTVTGHLTPSQNKEYRRQQGWPA